jgi:hypothetical protein
VDTREPVHHAEEFPLILKMPKEDFQQRSYVIIFGIQKKKKEKLGYLRRNRSK